MAPEHRPGISKFQCQQCSNYFRREDHLRRHQLTHKPPRYACSHQGCGMLFHRQDVLKRHQEVHTDDPRKKRRKPRRGVLPVCSADSTAVKGDTPESRDLSQGPDEQDEQPGEPTLDFLGWPSVDSVSPDSINTNLGPVMNGQEELHADKFHSIPLLQNPLDAVQQAGSQEDVSIDSPSTILACIQAFRDHFLPRLPFIHESNIEAAIASSEMKWSMAALGALCHDDCKGIANQLHQRSIQQSTRAESVLSDLRRLQNQVLMIEFAIWSRNRERRQWAIKQQQITSNAINEFLRGISSGAAPETDWDSWKTAEELKRTIFVFYINGITAAAFLGLQVPLAGRSLDLDLPCSESTWNAPSESDWGVCLELWGRENTPFHAAAFAIIARDKMADCHHESASSFNQYILLCSLLEEIIYGRKSALNYSSLDGWRDGKMEDFGLRDKLIEALEFCKGLWWASPEFFWNRGSRAHPQTENILLMNYLLVTLTDFKEVPPHLENQYMLGVGVAAEVFYSCSKIGFIEVSFNCRSTISRPARYCAVACARRLKHWARGIDPSKENAFTKQEGSIVFQVCQALKRGRSEGLGIYLTCLSHSEQFEQAITDISSMIFGSTAWLSPLEATP